MSNIFTSSIGGLTTITSGTEYTAGYDAFLYIHDAYADNSFDIYIDNVKVQQTNVRHTYSNPSAFMFVSKGQKWKVCRTGGGGSSRLEVACQTFSSRR